MNKPNFTIKLESGFEMWDGSEAPPILCVYISLDGNKDSDVDSITSDDIKDKLDTLLLKLMSENAINLYNSNVVDHEDLINDYDDSVRVLLTDDPAKPNTKIDPIVQFGPTHGRSWKQVVNSILKALKLKNRWKCVKKYGSDRHTWLYETTIESDNTIYNICDESYAAKSKARANSR